MNFSLSDFQKEIVDLIKIYQERNLIIMFLKMMKTSFFLGIDGKNAQK